jgi:hypothetical protein
MAFRAYSIFFHPSHMHDLLEVNSLPVYSEWKELMMQHPNEDDLYTVADRSRPFLAWVREVIRKKDDVTEKLPRIPYLTQGSARPAEYLRLLGPTDESLRSWWTWCTLLGDAICGGRKASIEMAKLKIALLTRLVTNENQPQSPDLVDRLYALRLISASGLVVRLTDHQYFQHHRGLSIGPTDAWRDQSSKHIQLFRISHNISNDELYKAVARLRKVEIWQIQLWMIITKVYSIGEENSAKTILARVESTRL